MENIVKDEVIIEKKKKGRQIIKNIPESNEPEPEFSCSICKNKKPKSDFQKDRTRVMGIKNYICRACNYKRYIAKKMESYKKREIELKENTEEYPTPNFNELFKKNEGYTVGVFGSSRSGKTTFLKWLYENFLYKNYDVKIMFSSNSHKKDYEVFTKNKGLLYDKFNNELCLMLHAIQKKTKNYYDMLIMLDDEINQKHSNVLQNAIITWRNANISTVVSLQATTLMNKNSRNNLHRLFLLKLNSNEEIISICEKLLMGIIPIPPNITKKQDKLTYLQKWYIENTQDYNIILIDTLDNFKIYKFKVPL